MISRRLGYQELG